MTRPFDYYHLFVDSFSGIKLEIYKAHSGVFVDDGILIYSCTGDEALRLYKLLIAFYSSQDRNFFIQQNFDK